MLSTIFNCVSVTQISYSVLLKQKYLIFLVLNKSLFTFYISLQFNLTHYWQPLQVLKYLIVKK